LQSSFILRTSSPQLQQIPTPSSAKCQTTSPTYTPHPIQAKTPPACSPLTCHPGDVQPGQVLTVVVCRICTQCQQEQLLTTNATRTVASAVKSLKDEHRTHVALNYCYVVGTFTLRIPVTMAPVILPPEEDIFAIMKWRLPQLSQSNRWYPVFVRYISYISVRVSELGGNSSCIAPPPWGTRPGPIAKKKREDTGRVAGIIYDSCGDF
jgi:hypothetical protein